MLLFSAKVVTDNNKGISVMLIGGFGFLMTLLFLLIQPLMVYAGYCLMASILGMAIAAVVANGDIATYHLNEGFKVYKNKMEIRHLVFTFAEIHSLQFTFVSFQGMRKYSYEPDPDANLKYTSGTNIYGIDNILSFRYKNQTYNYRFHVQNQQHFFQFVQMLEQLYIMQIPFTEKNWHGKTFMMNNVSNKQYEKLKQQYM